MVVLLEIMRLANCAMAGLAAIIGILIASGIPELTVASEVFLAVVLITGGGNAINDYFDRDIDAINRPRRPIPSGRLSPRWALTWSLVLFAAGCATAGALNRLCLILALTNSALLIIYARHLKGTPLAGNISVAYLTGSTLLFGGLSMGAEQVLASPIPVLSILAALATLGREIEKDIEDLEGDRRKGARTLPIVAGEAFSSRLAAAAVTLAVLFSYLPALGNLYLAAVTLANVFFIMATKRALDGNASRSQQYIKRGMALALAAFLAGSLA